MPGEFRDRQNYIGSITDSVYDADYVPPPVGEMLVALDAQIAMFVSVITPINVFYVALAYASGTPCAIHINPLHYTHSSP